MTGAAGGGAARPITRLKTLMERSILGLGINAAARLGAHRYVDGEREDAAGVLAALGGAAAILTTIGDAGVVSALIPGLARGGDGWCCLGSERIRWRLPWDRSSAASAG